MKNDLGDKDDIGGDDAVVDHIGGDKDENPFA